MWISLCLLLCAYASAQSGPQAISFLTPPLKGPQIPAVKQETPPLIAPIQKPVHFTPPMQKPATVVHKIPTLPATTAAYVSTAAVGLTNLAGAHTSVLPSSTGTSSNTAKPGGTAIFVPSTAKPNGGGSMTSGAWNHNTAGGSIQPITKRASALTSGAVKPNTAQPGTVAPSSKPHSSSKASSKSSNPSGAPLTSKPPGLVSNNPVSSKKEDGGMSSGTVAAVVLASLGGVALIVSAAALIVAAKNNRKKNKVIDVKEAGKSQPDPVFNRPRPPPTRNRPYDFY